MAIKYGLSLDVTVAVNNYLMSDASVIWDATVNAAYNNDIAGIGRDDLSALNQKQSKSVNADAIVTIGLGSIDVTNEANANTFAADKNFLIWGNDNASIALQDTEIPATATADYRLGREWKVAETGSVSNLTVRFFTGVLPTTVSNIELFVDTDGDGDFTNATVIPGGVLTGDVVTFTGIDLNDDDVFTIGYSLPSPGGVFSAETNGIAYKHYDAFTADLSVGINGNLIGTGYVANFTNVDDVFLNERADQFAMEYTTQLQIDVAGNYTFRSNGLDDTQAMWLDGNLVLNWVTTGVNTVTTAAIPLTVGRHTIVIRFSEIAGGQTLNMTYSGPSTGGFIAIPDNKLFVPAQLGLWLKANAGVTAGGDATTPTVWGDQSANGNNVTTTEGTPLYYNTTQSEMLNFNPSINFQNDAMTSADNTKGLAFDKQSRTVFAVATSSTNTGSNYIFSQGRDAVTSAHFGIRNNGSSLDLIGWANDINSPGYWTVNQPEIVTGLYENFNINGTNNATLYGKGESLVQGNKNWRTLLNDNYDFSIGDLVDNNESFNGHITEVIYYPWNLSTLERSKVQSYLAIKYGITLDQTVATDYIASDATVIWNATTNAAYNNDIAGIGTDEISALTQKQTKSVNTDAIVTIGLGSIDATNAANANTFTADKNFLVWGNDNVSTAVVNTGIPSSFSEKIIRNWLVNETGAVGNTLVQIPNSAVAGFTNTTALQLFVADDAGFTTNLVAIPLVQNGANWEATVDFNGVKYFTFGIVASGDFMRHGKTFQGGTEQPMKF